MDVAWSLVRNPQSNKALKYGKVLLPDSSIPISALKLNGERRCPMKTYNFSKEDLEYLVPVEANKQALETAVKVYIVNVVMPRLGMKTTDNVQYDIGKGILTVLDPPEEQTKPEEPKA